MAFEAYRSNPELILTDTHNFISQMWDVGQLFEYGELNVEKFWEYLIDFVEIVQKFENTTNVDVRIRQFKSKLSNYFNTDIGTTRFIVLDWFRKRRMVRGASPIEFVRMELNPYLEYLLAFITDNKERFVVKTTAFDKTITLPFIGTVSVLTALLILLIFIYLYTVLFGKTSTRRTSRSSNVTDLLKVLKSK